MGFPISFASAVGHSFPRVCIPISVFPPLVFGRLDGLPSALHCPRAIVYAPLLFIFNLICTLFLLRLMFNGLFIHCFLFFPEADKKKPSGKHAIKVFRFHFLPLSLSFQKFPPFPAHPRIGWFSPSFSPPATKIHIFTHSTARFPSLLHGVASTSTPRSLLNSL